MGSPSTVTAPESACSTPMIMRMAVVLPAPLPPTNPVIMPGLMTKLMSVRTWWSPNDLCILSSLITFPIYTGTTAPQLECARDGFRCGNNAVHKFFCIREVIGHDHRQGRHGLSTLCSDGRRNRRYPKLCFFANERISLTSDVVEVAAETFGMRDGFRRELGQRLR